VNLHFKQSSSLDPMPTVSFSVWNNYKLWFNSKTISW